MNPLRRIRLTCVLTSMLSLRMGLQRASPDPSQPLNGHWHRFANTMETTRMRERIQPRAERDRGWHAACNEGRADTGREASGSRADGGTRSRWGSGISGVRKRRAKVGHLHRRTVFRTTTAAERRTSPRSSKCSSSSGASGARGLVPSFHTSKPRRSNVRRSLGVAAAKEGWTNTSWP